MFLLSRSQVQTVGRPMNQNHNRTISRGAEELCKLMRVWTISAHSKPVSKQLWSAPGSAPLLPALLPKSSRFLVQCVRETFDWTDVWSVSREQVSSPSPQGLRETQSNTFQTGRECVHKLPPLRRDGSRSSRRDSHCEPLLLVKAARKYSWNDLFYESEEAIRIRSEVCVSSLR